MNQLQCFKLIFNGSLICKNAFMKVTKISKSTLSIHMKNVLEHGHINADHGNTGTMKKIEHVLEASAWLQAYIDDHADYSPFETRQVEANGE